MVMAKRKKDALSLMRKSLGREAADAILGKADKLARKGASASAIEKAILRDLVKFLRKLIELLKIIDIDVPTR
jgi:hypothetical protein